MANIKVKFKEAYQDFGAYALLKNVTDKGVLIVDGTEVLNSIADLPTTNTVDGQEKAVIVQNGQVVTTSINNIGGGGGGIAIGDAITDADAASILYVDGSGNLAQDSGFTRTSTNTTILNSIDFGGGNTIQGGFVSNSGILSLAGEHSISGVPQRTTRLVSDPTEGEASATVINAITGDSYGVKAQGGIATFGAIDGGNGTKIEVEDFTSLVKITNVPTYADDAAAGVGGLTSGMLYKTTTTGVTALNIVP